MSTTFPTTLDNYGADLTNANTCSASHINNPADAIKAIEVKVGIDKSAVETAIDYLLKSMSGHNHDGVNSKIIDDYKTGDWILSTITTPRTGWSNVSSTYSNKFIRFNATPLGTGGSDTHTHGGGSYSVGNHVHTSSYAGPSHTHTGTTGTTQQGAQGSNYGEAQQVVIPNTHTHSMGTTGYSGSGAVTGSSQSAGGGSVSNSSSSESNIPIYIKCVVFQKD